MSRKETAVKMKRSEMLYYRMLAVIAALLAVITGIQYAGKRVEPYPVFALVLTVCFGAFAVAAIVMAILKAVKKKNNKKERVVFDAPFLAGFFMCLALAFGTLWLNTVSSRRLILYVTLCALTYLVYCLFDREIFSFSVYTLVGGVVLSLLRSALSFEKTMITVVIALYAILALVVTIVGRTRNIKVGKQLIFGKSFRAYPYYISAGILLAGVVMSYFVVGSEIYSLAVLGIYYLVYTVVSALKDM